MGSPSISSSSEEDGDEEWKAAISSIAASVDPFLALNSASAAANGTSDRSKRSGGDDDDSNHHQNKSRLPKHYQMKALKLLDEIVEKNLEIVRGPCDIPDNNAVPDDGGVRLFKSAPRGIVFDHTDEPKGPTKKPRLLPGEEIDEKSKKFRRQLDSVVVDGLDVIAVAKAAGEKSLARLEAKEARGKAAAKRQEERVAELKRIRGERWLPSIAKEKKLQPQGKTKS